MPLDIHAGLAVQEPLESCEFTGMRCILGILGSVHQKGGRKELNNEQARFLGVYPRACRRAMQAGNAKKQLDPPTGRHQIGKGRCFSNGMLLEPNVINLAAMDTSLFGCSRKRTC